jgi:hypothetical protein
MSRDEGEAQCRGGKRDRGQRITGHCEHASNKHAAKKSSREKCAPPSKSFHAKLERECHVANHIALMLEQFAICAMGSPTSRFHSELSRLRSVFARRLEEGD